MPLHTDMRYYYVEDEKKGLIDANIPLSKFLWRIRATSYCVYSFIEAHDPNTYVHFVDFAEQHLMLHDEDGDDLQVRFDVMEIIVVMNAQRELKRYFYDENAVGVPIEYFHDLLSLLDTRAGLVLEGESGLNDR